MPRIITVATSRLLPRQPYGIGVEPVAYYMNEIRSGREIRPVPLVPLEDGPDTDLIIADGHHRAVAHHLAGVAMQGMVYENDREIAVVTPEDRLALGHYISLEEFRGDYLNFFVPRMIAGRCLTMAQYADVHIPNRSDIES